LNIALLRQAYHGVWGLYHVTHIEVAHHPSRGYDTQTKASRNGGVLDHNSFHNRIRNGIVELHTVTRWHNCSIVSSSRTYVICPQIQPLRMPKCNASFGLTTYARQCEHSAAKSGKLSTHWCTLCTSSIFAYIIKSETEGDGIQSILHPALKLLWNLARKSH
jgi:hypothetical protein